MRVEQVALELVDPDPDQPRKIMDEEELQELSRSIESFGQLQPVIVVRMGKRFHLVDGHRRHAAIGLLGRRELAAIVFPEAHSDDQRLMVQLTANCLRSDLRPVEKAHAFARLKGMNNWSNAELAKNLHLSKSQVTVCLSLLSHPPEIQAKIDSGEISPSTAYAIARAPDDASRADLLDQAVHGELSRADAVKRVKRRAAAPKPGTRMVCRLPEGCVTIETSANQSLETIASLLRKLGQECRAAAQQGFDTGTLERILADKCRNQVNATASGSSS